MDKALAHPLLVTVRRLAGVVSPAPPADLGSTNGTRVNGEAIVRCRLEPGDHLALGDESLLVD